MAPSGLILAISGSISAFGVGLGGGLGLSDTTASASPTQPPPSCFQCPGGATTGASSSTPVSTFRVTFPATSRGVTSQSTGSRPTGSNRAGGDRGSGRTASTGSSVTPRPPSGDHGSWEQPLAGTLRAVAASLPDPTKLSPVYTLLLLIPGATLLFAGGTLYAAVTRDSRRRRREFFDPPSSYSG